MSDRERDVQRAIRYTEIIDKNGWEGEDMLGACKTLVSALREARAYADRMTRIANAVIDAQERQHIRNVGLGLPRSEHFLDIEKALDTE